MLLKPKATLLQLAYGVNRQLSLRTCGIMENLWFLVHLRILLRLTYPALLLHFCVGCVSSWLLGKTVVVRPSDTGNAFTSLNEFFY